MPRAERSHEHESIADPVSKALWYIETHLDYDLTLDLIEKNAGMSRFALTRAFAAVSGLQVMRYVRGRRVTEAARALASGAPDILTVALDFRYQSHEAFTRAFRDQFEATPEAVRELGTVAGLALVEAVRREKFDPIPLEEPRIEVGRRLLLAGLTERDYKRIPVLWQRFGPYIGVLSGQVGHDSYGVCANADDDGNFTYLAAVEVGTFYDVPTELTTLRLPESRYAVFVHRDHVSTIRSTFQAIWRQWQPQNDVIDAPFFEHYGDDFDADAGTGPVEIWIPIP